MKPMHIGRAGWMDMGNTCTDYLSIHCASMVNTIGNHQAKTYGERNPFVTTSRRSLKGPKKSNPKLAGSAERAPPSIRPESFDPLPFRGHRRKCRSPFTKNLWSLRGLVQGPMPRSTNAIMTRTPRHLACRLSLSTMVPITTDSHTE